jgi:signal recognition particle subunit SRP54
MFDALSDRLERIAGRLRSRGRLSDADLDEALREIRVALLEADVEVGVARMFVQGIRERCSGEALSKSLTPGQQVVKAVHEELVAVLGGETLKLTYASRPPTVVLLAGLQGSGKTTTAAKLARWWRQQGRNPLLVGADLQRPAAVEQLRVLGRQVGVTVFSEPTDPLAVARAGLEEARRLGRDICIVDTAGRLAIDEELMDEVRRVSDAVQPHYTLLVIDAMTGQDAVATARAFHQALELDGVILTKLDGDARGGAALSVKGVIGRPIVFASTGEKLGDFDLFHPDRMADRILGMGDVLSLIEQAERAMDKESVARSAGRLMEGRFTLDDFLEQLQQVKKLGSLGGVMKLLPGMTKELRQAADQIDDRELARVEAIMRSMTPVERADPSIIDGSRRVRIARGSGTATADVNHLLKQHREMQKLVKGMASGGGLPGMPGLGGAPGGKGLGGMGGLGGLLGSRKQLAALQALGDEMEGAPQGLAGLLGGGGGGLPSLDAVASGGRPAGGNGAARTQRGAKGKKKKGGRVTPPKGR